MIKDYSRYKPAEIARFLSKELFLIEVDALAGMQLRGNYEYMPDVVNGETIVDYSKKERIMATIYGLVELYENGNNIRVVKTDDIINIYTLIYTHFKNIDNLSSNSIHPLKIDTEGLKILAMFAEEIFENNKSSLTRHEIDLLEEKMKIVSPLGFTDMSSVFRELNYLPTTIDKRGHGQEQHQGVLKEAQRELLY